ncbi:MAG: Asp23/Gls24 family envelope stress response protein [Actinobacteria bacterium]|nr:MAG: Asp23/Gls24 family envelope stress response protein [Actinomycetota bacterium]
MARPESHGHITISDEVLAELVGFAALECYGVVGMANPTLKAGVAQLLSRDKLAKGIEISQAGERVTVDLYVVIEYGTNLAEVSRNLREAVTYTLRQQAEVEVADVVVHVQAINVREDA